ncbi:MAG: PAS domain S-box protein [Promethearchaeota archaeon]|jgi:PAS domain S-box-containing protein
MTSPPSNIFSSFESDQIQNLLKHPKEDLPEVIRLLERKVEEEINKSLVSEKKLKETEQRFRSLIEQTTDAVFCYEYTPPIPLNLPIEEQVKRLYDGVLVDCNLVCARSYGVDRVEDVVGRRLTDLFGTIPNSLDELFRNMVEGGYQIIDGVGIEKLPNGEERYFLNNGHGVIENNSVVRIWGTFRDVTDRKKAEEKLYREQDLVHTLLGNHPDFIYFKDRNGRFQYISTQFCDYFNRKMEDIIGKTNLDLFPPEIAKPTYAEELQIMHSGISVINKEETDGKIWVLTTKIPWYDKEGRLKGLFGISRDITNLKKVERELKESEELYRSLTEGLSQTGIGIDIVDSNYKIIYQNQFLKEQFGEAINQLCYEFYLGREKRCENCPMVKAIQSKKVEKDVITAPNNRTYEIIAAPLPNLSGEIERAAEVVIDITERIESEQRLKESEEKFRNIAENSSIGISIAQDNQLKYVNKQAAQLLGYTVEEMTGWSFNDVLKSIHHDDLTAVTDGMRKTLNNTDNALEHLEYRVITKSGQMIWTDTYSSKIMYEGKPAFLIISLDVTEKKEAEQKYKSLINNLTDIILEIDLKGVVTYVSPQCYDILGYRPNELTGQSTVKFIFPEDMVKLTDAWKLGINTGEVVSVIEYRLIHKNGNIIHVSAKGKYVNGGGNEKFILAIRDITAQRKIEQDLKLSEEKYRLLFDNSPIGIGLSTIEGKALDGNESIINLTGYTIESLNEVGLNSIYAEPNERSKILKILQEDGKLRDYEIKIRRKDNSEFYGSICLDLMELGGKKIIQISLRDITENKIAEQELIKLTNLKSELLRRTSHELKTPLVSIKGFSDLLLQVHRDKLDSFVISILNEIKQGCLRLENLIADILQTSELESGTISLNSSEEDLSFLIRLCVKEIKGLSILRNQHINLEIPENLKTWFEKEQVHQVISNLLNNAVKYTPPGGLIEIKSEIQNELIITSIKDNGIGIIDDEKGRIFQQFGKVERYGQGLDIISEGSGLGLYISKKIIELHNGKLWVESEGRHKGSTFYFSLPLIKKS